LAELEVFLKRFVLGARLGEWKIFYREKRLGWNIHAFELSSTSLKRLKSPSPSLVVITIIISAATTIDYLVSGSHVPSCYPYFLVVPL